MRCYRQQLDKDSVLYDSGQWSAGYCENYNKYREMQMKIIKPHKTIMELSEISVIITQKLYETPPKYEKILKMGTLPFNWGVFFFACDII